MVIVRAEVKSQCKIPNDPIGNRTRDLPECSALPQTTQSSPLNNTLLTNYSLYFNINFDSSLRRYLCLMTLVRTCLSLPCPVPPKLFSIHQFIFLLSLSTCSFLCFSVAEVPVSLPGLVFLPCQYC